MSKRIEYIDIARGIGILLVVMGHNDFAAISPYFYKLIYSFHMPLFFFLSGYFLSTAIGFWPFVKKRFNSLLKPYFFTIFLIYFFSISFEKMSFATALTRITKSFYGAGHYLDWVQLWFLPHLFVVSLYAYFFYKTAGRIQYRIIRWLILLLTLFIAGLYLSTFYPFKVAVFGKGYELFGLPFSLDLVLLSGFFFILGSETHTMKTEDLYGNIFFLLGTGVSLVLMVLIFPARIDFNTRLFESFIINTVEAVVGILFILSISRHIDLYSARVGSIFKYFGRISLIILLLHVPIQDFWGQKIMVVTGNQTLSIWLAFVMGVAGSVLLYELFVKHNPVALFWLGMRPDLPGRAREQSQPAPAELPDGQKVSVEQELTR